MVSWIVDLVAGHRHRMVVGNIASRLRVGVCVHSSCRGVFEHRISGARRSQVRKWIDCGCLRTPHHNEQWATKVAYLI